MLLTRFRNGYNQEPADLLVIDLVGKSERILVSDGSGNINLPGSIWNEKTGQVVFSSTRDPHNEIFVIVGSGSSGEELKITSRSELVAYEPSMSPDGQWVVFESHPIDVDNNGMIVKYAIDGTSQYETLSEVGKDSRQPNWSPAGDLIVFQVFDHGQWDIWIMEANGTSHRRLTIGAGDQTDPSFSPDGQWVVYSSEASGEDEANLFIIPTDGGSPIRVTQFEGYDGAPSWSPDGEMIAFESCPGDPTMSEGTTIWTIEVPAH